MKKLLLVLLVWFFVCHFSTAQQGFQPVPELPYHAVPNFFNFPKGMIQGEAAGVAVNSKGHIYLFQRTKPMLTEYDEAGNYFRASGKAYFSTRTACESMRTKIYGRRTMATIWYSSYRLPARCCWF